jgi:hypothetical protein
MNMKYIKNLAIATTLLASVSLASCDMSDFGDLNVSPNKPSEAYTSMMFTFSARYVRYNVMTAYSYDPWPMLRTGYLAEAMNNQYGSMNTTTTFGTTNYYRYVIRNLNTIIEMNEDEDQKSETAVLSFGDNANQIAVARTLRAYFYMTLTDILGPIAYSEAFKGESEDNWTPKYDSQEDVFTGLDTDLREAYSQFNTSGSLTNADILYNGDVSKWKKFNATLRMMLAIKLADVAPEVGKSRFLQAYNDGGITEVEDGFHYTFDSNSEAYSWLYYVGNLDYSARSLRYGPNKVIVDELKERNDPRMFSYFTLDGYMGTVDGDPNDVNAYKGIPFGLESNDAVLMEAEGACSVNATYCDPQATYGIITAARSLLVEAEAAELGWISASAKDLYEAGIRASFGFQAAYHTAVSGVEDYLAQPEIQLSSNKEEALNQIAMQRFLAGFMTDGIEAWSDWRRYNVPTLPIYAGQALEGVEVYPYRLAYAETDKQYNVENTDEVIEKYLNGSDDMWQRVWWDTKDNK